MMLEYVWKRCLEICERRSALVRLIGALVYSLQEEEEEDHVVAQVLGVLVYPRFS